MNDIVHYLNRTEAECIAAGQTSICLGCKALGHPFGRGGVWGETWISAFFTGDNRRDAVTEWREELGYDPITGEAL